MWPEVVEDSRKTTATIRATMASMVILMTIKAHMGATGIRTKRGTIALTAALTPAMPTGSLVDEGAVPFRSRICMMTMTNMTVPMRAAAR